MHNIKNPLIFIVEDSVVYKELIVGHLKSNNYANVKTFKNGDECMKEIEQKPDLVILDYAIEGMNGLDLMLKTLDEHPETDFVFLSGQNDVEVAVKLMRLGAADYIVKNEKAPYKLVKSIEQLKSTRKRQRVQKGFKIGVVGFFIMLFLIIMVIILMTIFFNIEV